MASATTYKKAPTADADQGVIGVNLEGARANNPQKKSCLQRLKEMEKNIIFLVICIALLIAVIIAIIVTKTRGGYDKSANADAHAQLPPPTNVTLFIVGFRHGNRNPGKFLTGDETYKQWAWQGKNQLTNIGITQAYTLGEFLRQRYNEKFVRSKFFPDEVKAYSSSAEKCQQTLQSVMTGFYKPQGNSSWSDKLNWQPVPYEINDPLLRMYNIDCPTYKLAYGGIADDSIQSASDWLSRNETVVNYIAEHARVSPSLSDLGDVADNIGNMKMQGVKLPEWVTNPKLQGYPRGRDMYKDIMSFAEAHQILCAKHNPCRNIMAGLWLNQVIELLRNKSNGSLKDRKAHFYAAHTETVLSMINLMRAINVTETPTSAGFILEYRDEPEPSVRFIFHEPHPEKPHVRLAEVKHLEYCPKEEWCPLEVFIAHNRPRAFKNWQTECETNKCPL